MLFEVCGCGASLLQLFQDGLIRIIEPNIGHETVFDETNNQCYWFIKLIYIVNYIPQDEGLYGKGRPETTVMERTENSIGAKRLRCWRTILSQLTEE